MTGQDEREVPNMEYLTAWARREFGVSNGTQMWVEFQGSAEMLAKAVLDILPPQITPTAEAKAEAPRSVCGERIPGTVPSWAGEDQIDPCRCILPRGHDGPCQCEHDATHLRENGGAR